MIDGLSNKQTAAWLFISEHTVDSHVRNIMNKLGVDTRADRRLDGVLRELARGSDD